MENLNEILRLVVLAFVVESVWETLKMAYDKDKISKSAIGALAVGITVALTVNFDILKVLEFNPVIPYVGVVLSGILISRGGNFVHELIKKLKGGEVSNG